MMLGVVWIISFLAVCQASPLPHRPKYDQRQEGKWNVRADLENFIILVIPTSTSSSASNGSLLDFLSKTIPLPHYKKIKNVHHQHQEDGNLPDAEQFLESKTAPYHVDISRARDHLAKLHPEVSIPESIKEDIIIARSPSVALTKSQENDENKENNLLRNARAILITVPMENENVQRHGVKDVIGGKGGEDIKKTLGMSIDAIEKGLSLAAEKQKIPLKNDDEVEAIEIIVTDKPTLNETYYADSLEKIANEVRKTHAIILAKVVHVGLVEYFRKLAEKLKEKTETDDSMNDEEDIVVERGKENLPKFFSNVKAKVGKISEMKEKRQVKEKSGHKENKDKVMLTKEDNGVPKMELEPPMIQQENNKASEASKENSKDELLLLGAELEQCGPGQERDTSGICTSSPVVKP